jgi:hypothetical protein
MTLNTKQQKTLEAVFAKPTRSNILFSDIENLFKGLGGQIIEGSGSRVKCEYREGKVWDAHRPHPGKEAKRYQVETLRTLLIQWDIKP